MKIMKVELRPFRAQTLVLCLGLACVVLMATAAAAFAQRLPGTENGEWRYLGGDAGHTRYSPLDQINAGNFADLEVAWMFRGDNFGQTPTPQSRSTPTYVDGILYTVAGERRTVVAMDPATGARPCGPSASRIRGGGSGRCGGITGRGFRTGR